MANIARYYKTDIFAARDQFLAGCNAIGLPVSTYAGRGTGTQADDQPIYADVALAGSPDADGLIVLSSAVGGASGFFASSVMVAFLREKLYQELPRNVACLLIHAINPKGPIWPSNRLMRDNHPLPPASDWTKQLLVETDARYIEDRNARENGVVLNRSSLESLPLSAMAMPAWDEGVLGDIESKFLRDRQQITVIDFEVVDDLIDGEVKLGYAERVVPAGMGDLSDCFEGLVEHSLFDMMPSVGLVDQAGRQANILSVKANVQQDLQINACWPDISTIVRNIIQRMPAS